MKNRTIVMLLAMSTIWMSSGAAVAQTDPSKFPLSKAIPDDVFIAVSAKTNPERKFLDEYWGEVIKAFMDSGVMTDVWDMVTDAVPDEELDQVEETMDRFSELCNKIEWCHLFDKEFVYCGRFTSNMGPGFHEGMFIGRSEKEKAGSNYSGLKKLLSELVKFANEKAGSSIATLDESKKGGASVASLTFPAGPGFAISVAQMDDVVFLTFGGTTLLEEGMNLLKGEGDRRGIVSSPRFKQAFDQLPPAEDTMVFFDVEGMMSTFRTMLAAFGAEAGPAGKKSEGGQEKLKDDSGKEPEAGSDEKSEGKDDEGGGDEPAEEEVNPMQIISQLMHDVSIIDYMATSEWTDGYRVFSDSVTVLRTSAKSSPIYEVVTSGKPTTNFEKYIPEEAVSFSVSSGINWTKAYRYVINFVEKNVPDGEGIIKHWNSVQKNELHLDVENDVLSLFEGSVANYQSGKDWVLLFKITDEKKMNEQLTRLMTFVNGMMGQNGLMISKVKVGEKAEFHQISHPMMMMMGGMQPPVLGCADGHLIVGSSAATVKTCLNTAAGKHDNITKNKRWQEEALMPTGSVLGVTFTDEANMGQELQAAMGGMSMGIGMMAGMAMGDAPPDVKRMVGAIPQILAKLGPVAGRLDFFKSHASYESFDGKKWVMHSVQNYKKQSERPVRAEESDEPAADSKDEAKKEKEDSESESE